MRLSQLPPPARTYVLGIYALAVGIVLAEAQLAGARLDQGLLPLADGVPGSLWLFVLLTLGATAAHSFPVTSPGRQAYHVSSPFIIAAIILLPPIQLTLLLACLHLGEWILQRQRAWFIQLFNLAAYVVCAAAAQAVHAILQPALTTAPIQLEDAQSVLAGLATVATFAVLNRGLVSLAIWLSNGIPPRQQQMFDPERVVTDVTLLAMGLPLAQLALMTPWAVLLATAPLIPMHRALDLPNLRRQRRQDALTELSTAPAFAEACRRELSRAQRFQRPLALLRIDVDDLERIQAEFGPHTRDAVLKGTARTIEELTRGYDVAARVDDEQFAVLLPEADLAGAQETAERLRAIIGARAWEVPTSLDPLRITVSTGLAVSHSEGQTVEHFFAAAGAALAQAKRLGGNRTSTAAVLPPLQAESAAPAAPAEAPAGLAAAGGPGPAPRGSKLDAWPALLGWLLDRGPSLVVGVVSVAAAGLVVLSASSFAALDASTLLLLLVCVAGAEALSMELFDRSSFSISLVPILAAGMLMGVPGVLLVVPAAPLMRAARRRTRWYKVLFNVASMGLAASAAAAVYGYLAPPMSTSNLLTLLVPAAVAGLTFYLHTALVAVAMATELKTAPHRVWAENFRWLWPQYVTLSLMGLLMSVAYREFGVVGAAAFATPPLMMRYVAKQYIDHTLGYVRQLRALNDQLTREIGQREAMEEENVRLAREASEAELQALRELSRMKSEFISIASHELRTPMTTILGFSELLLADLPDESPARDSLSVIHEDAVQLSRLVDNLMDVSRIETGRISVDPVAVDLLAVLPPLLHSLEPSARSHALVADVAPEARWVQADPAKLQQILTNLVSNAVKYSPSGGQVLVTARREPGAERVSLAVSDEGIGIPAEHRERIFERFQRVDASETRTIRGTGLGLYIVRQLVQLHGGAIRVESTPGLGSTFHFTLAAAAPLPIIGAGGPTHVARFAAAQ